MTCFFEFDEKLTFLVIKNAFLTVFFIKNSGWAMCLLLTAANLILSSIRRGAKKWLRALSSSRDLGCDDGHGLWRVAVEVPAAAAGFFEDALSPYLETMAVMELPAGDVTEMVFTNHTPMIVEGFVQHKPDAELLRRCIRRLAARDEEAMLRLCTCQKEWARDVQAARGARTKH